MIGKKIKTYRDFCGYIESDRWFLAETRLAEFRQENPDLCQEYRQRYLREQGRSDRLGYRILTNIR